MRDLNQFWTVRRMADARVGFVRLGALRLWLARADQEWGYAVEHGETALDLVDWTTVPPDVVPPQLDWQHFAFATAPREIRLAPSVPDRPVVVGSEHPIWLPRGEHMRLYVKVPVVLELKLQVGSSELELGRVASQPLKDTWFGDPTEGMLSYAVPLPAVRDATQLAALPNHIVCPVNVENRAKELLKLEKICIRPRQLALYGGLRHLWSSALQIVHEGGLRSARIEYGRSAPETDLQLLSAAPESTENSLSRFTFGSHYSKDLVLSK